MSNGDLDKQIDPFTVRDALILHDKRINQLTDTNYDTQNIVKSFEEKMKTLLERINQGVSPTMQNIQRQNEELKNQIIEFKGDVNTRFKDIEGKLNLQDDHFANKIEEIDTWLTGVKGLLWKVSTALIISAILGGVGLYVYVHKSAAQNEAIMKILTNPPPKVK